MTLSFCLLIASMYASQDLTTPGHSLLRPGAWRLSAGPVVTVTPSSMGGWAFTNEQIGAACTTTALCALVAGPTGMPHGSGSAELATQASTDGIAIGRAGYAATRLDQLTELSYSTYRQSVDAGNNLAIALQLNVDYDLADADSSYQGRLVYEPYRTVLGGVLQGTWQRWDTRAGKWWGTRATVKKTGASVSNPCVQASPCTWAQALVLFPNLGIHKVYGAVVMKAGSGWAAFRGNVDALSIGVGGVTTTFDFEENSPRVTLIPPDSAPLALFESLGSVSGPPLPPGPHRKDIVHVTFQLRTPLAARQAAIDSIGGRVVGGTLYPDKTDGTYYVQITGGTTAALLKAVVILKRQPQVSMAGWWEQFITPDGAFLSPNQTVSLVPPDTVSAALLDSLGTVSGAPLSAGQYRKDVVIVEFEVGTGLAQRQAAIDSVRGIVIGGRLWAEGGDGTYFVRITGGTTAALLNAVGILQRQPGVGRAIWWSLTLPDEAGSRRPIESPGVADWKIDPATPDESIPNRAIESVRAEGRRPST